MFASALTPKGADGNLFARIGDLQNSLAQVQSGDMGEQKMSQIRTVVKGMFTEEAANLTKVQAWKESMWDTPYAESLLELVESTHAVAQANGEADPVSLIQGDGDDSVFKKPNLNDARHVTNEVLKTVGKAVKQIGQFQATVGGTMEAVGAGKKDMDWRVFALLNPNLLCFFTDMSFLPCVTFDICMGIAMEVTTLPTWWAKQSWQLLTVPGNIYGSLKSMKDATTICSVVNMIAATQMPPVTTRLKSIKGGKDLRVKKIKSFIDKAGRSVKSWLPAKKKTEEGEE